MCDSWALPGLCGAFTCMVLRPRSFSGRVCSHCCCIATQLMVHSVLTHFHIRLRSLQPFRQHGRPGVWRWCVPQGPQGHDPVSHLAAAGLWPYSSHHMATGAYCGFLISGDRAAACTFPGQPVLQRLRRFRAPSGYGSASDDLAGVPQI